MARLNTFVHVLDDKGESHEFGPEMHIPKWAREKITNPNVWDVRPPDPVEQDDEEPVGAVVVTATGEGEGTGDNVVAEGGDDDGDGEPPAVVTGAGSPPPQTGPAATRQVWADYAEPLLRAKGIEIPADWKRGDIIAACQNAGIAV